MVTSHEEYQRKLRTPRQAIDLLRPDDVIHDDHSPTQAEVVHKAFRDALDARELRTELVVIHHLRQAGQARRQVHRLVVAARGIEKPPHATG